MGYRDAFANGVLNYSPLQQPFPYACGAGGETILTCKVLMPLAGLVINVLWSQGQLCRPLQTSYSDMRAIRMGCLTAFTLVKWNRIQG